MMPDEPVQRGAWGVAHGLQWGIDPPSSRRRLGRRLLIWFPAAAYALISVYYLAVAIGKHTGHVGVPLFSVILAGSSYLIMLALMPTPRIVRREGRIDLILAGLRGRELLWGVARPVLQGAAILVALHVLQTVITVATFGSQYSDELIGNDRGLMLLINFVPILPLLVGAGMAPCLWVLAKHRLTRMILIAVVWMVDSFAALSIFAVHGDAPLIFASLVILAFDLIFPGMFMKELFLAAIRRIERIE